MSIQVIKCSTVVREMTGSAASVTCGLSDLGWWELREISRVEVEVARWVIGNISRIIHLQLYFARLW